MWYSTVRNQLTISYAMVQRNETKLLYCILRHTSGYIGQHSTSHSIDSYVTRSRSSITQLYKSIHFKFLISYLHYKYQIVSSDLIKLENLENPVD